MNLSDSDKHALIRYRLEQADRTILEAEHANGTAWWTAYYVMFAPVDRGSIRE